MPDTAVARRVARKEVRLFFSSPVAWLFLASFAAITLFAFFWVESFFARNVADVRPLFEWMPILLIFLCAALTMRMWSDERRNGTLEHVLTQPVSLWRFVLGKFWACFFLLLLALAATLPLPLTVHLIADLDWGPVLAGYLATSLLGAAYLSVGLTVSARTDNSIVSLIGTVALCGGLYLLGSSTLTGLFGSEIAEPLRLLGTGTRFESITRGVIDLRDLYYYFSLVLAFLAVNVFLLEKERWAYPAKTARHRRWRLATALLVINALLANVWLDRINILRLDVTEGRLYSISQPTHDYLAQLQEPLLIRGYFSAKTHPLLAPLVPQLRDLIREYEVAGQGKVRVEFVDPAQEPLLEQEANEQYNIQATPFQMADRYQAALVNSYFNVLVKYGDQFETLDFSDLIEIKSNMEGEAEVLLRNPEFDITRSIKDVLYAYRAGGNLFDGIDGEVEFIGYVSADNLLPQALLDYKNAISGQLQELVDSSGGRFSMRFIEPEAQDGLVARQIQEEWGFQPMTASLFEDNEFYFYLTLSDRRQVVQLPAGEFNATGFRQLLDAGLKRFASGFTRTVALVAPRVDPQMARFNIGGPTFNNLERAITASYSIRLDDLSSGQVDPDADILVLAAPDRLSEIQLFAVDQFLMRGGTVVLATSPFTSELAAGQLRMQPRDSGLADWLQHHGIEIEPALVLDEQNAAFPAPITRSSGGLQFQDVQMIDYPFFIDLREGGLHPEHPVTAGLPQLTMAWASPISITPQPGRDVSRLLQSSPRSWRSTSLEVMPGIDARGLSTFRTDGPQGSELLGAVIEGRFESYFKDRASPIQPTPGDNKEAQGDLAIQSVLGKSPESARIVLYASNDFMDDQILGAVVAAAGTQYLGPLEILVNTLEWSLEDGGLLQIRSRAHFNRTLPPMERQAQVVIEYFNYGLVVLFLLLLAAAHWLLTWLRKRHYRGAFA